MKVLLNILVTIVFMIDAKAYAVTCEAANGWFVIASPLETGVASFPGNTYLTVYDAEGDLVLGFSAISALSGNLPGPGMRDDFEICRVFKDKLGIHAFSWLTTYGGEMHSNQLHGSSGLIEIRSNSGHLDLRCQ